jgi:hypothetical protein
MTAGGSSVALDLAWFYWPVTFALAMGVAVGRLVRLGRGVSAGSSARAPLGAVAIASAGLPVVPLWLGISTQCDDRTQFHDFNLALVVAGFAGIIAWLFILSRLYVAAGQEEDRVERATLTMFFGLVVGMTVEFFASTITIEGYCSGARSGLVGQLAVAVMLGLITAAAWSRGPARDRVS